MAEYNLDWDELGKNIQDIIDRAVNSQDYQKLNQTIRNAVEKGINAGTDAVRRVVDGVSRTEKVSKPAVVEAAPKPVLYGSTGGKSLAAVCMTAGGGILSVATFGTLLTGLLLSMIGGGFGSVILSLLGLGAGVALLSGGVRSLNYLSRFKTYRRILGEKTHCTLEKLARGVGKSVKSVRKELHKMILDGLFLEGHLDKEETQLITSHETFRYYEQSRLQLEERKRLEEAKNAEKAAVTHTPQVRDVLSRGNAYIAEIRRCNDAIPGAEISEKIDRMERIIRRIFDRAEAHPEIVPDLKKLMDYYLPMTVKLLNAYADMDAQPYQGETIQASKREIEATLDTLNQAFEKLLDSVFMDTALDVSSDISVLNTLLAREGLLEDEISGMKNKTKP